MTEPLKGNPRRQAVDPMRGYRYQVLRTLHEWLGLRADEVIYVEGAEDFDRVSPDEAIATQVKDLAEGSTVTLRTPSVAAAINSYWSLCQRDGRSNIRLSFLTTAGVGHEKGRPFGENHKGITLWNFAGRGEDFSLVAAEATDIVKFIRDLDGLSQEIRDFLLSTDVESIWRRLIVPIVWYTSEPSTGDVEAAVDRKLTSICVEGKISPRWVPAIRDRLEREVWSTATRKADRVLHPETLHRAIAEATTIPVPASSMEQILNRLATWDASGQASIGEVPISSGYARVGTMPPMADRLILREALASEIQRVLLKRGVVVVRGSTGTGKTSLISQMLLGIEDRCIWVNCRDSRPAELRAALYNCARLIDAADRHTHVVLDDIDFPAHEHVLESDARGLIYTLHHRGGGLLVTSYRAPSYRWLSRATNGEQCDIEVSNFTSDDIEALLCIYGMPKAPGMKWLASSVLLHTAGHPQLVAARLAVLARDGFPVPSATDFLEIPREVVDERANVRAMLRDAVSREERDLLYRLSVVLGPFDRYRAIALATIGTPVAAAPGDVLDQVVGPWIERISGELYRVSPLLQGAGEEACGPAWATTMHRSIADAWCGFGTQSQWDICTILHHATLGRNDLAIRRVAGWLFFAKDTEWQSLADTNTVFAHCYSEPGTKFPGEVETVFCARFIQLGLALRSDSELAEKILCRIDEEISAQSEVGSIRLFRYVLLSTVVLYGIRLSLARLMAVASELASTDIASIQIEAKHFPRPPLPTATVRQGVGSLLIRRIQTVDELRDVIPFLHRIDVDARRPLFQIFRDYPDMGRYLADNLWLSEKRRQQPRWAELAEVLAALWSHAMEWGEVEMAQGTASVHARILHENLGDTGAALAILGRLNQPSAARSLVLDAHAKILSDKGEFGSALVLWREALPQLGCAAHNSFGYANSARNAAVAASNSGAWREACDLYEAASAAAHSSSVSTGPAYAAGLLADAAWAGWQSDQRSRAATLLAKSAEILSRVPNESDKVREYFVHKAVGHIALECLRLSEGQLQSGPIAPGACSTHEPGEEATALPRTPLEVTRACVVALAYTVGAADSRISEIANELRTAPYAFARGRALNALLTHAERNGDTSSLPQLIWEFSQALHALRAPKDNPWEADSMVGSDGPIEISHAVLEELWKLHLINGLFGAACRDVRLDKILEAWSKEGNSIDAPKGVLAWLDALRNLVQEDVQARVNAAKSQEWATRFAAVAVAVDIDDGNPAALIRVHASFISVAQSQMLARSWMHAGCDAFERAWRSACTRRFSLLAPDENIPRIVEVCESTGDPLSKVARLFLAALPAVNVRFPPQVVHAAKALIA